MKIGLALAGISSGIRNRDWRRTIEGIKDKAINCWSGHDVSIYLSSNNVSQELVNAYNATKYIGFSHPHANTYVDKVLKVLELMKDEDLDFIIMTRFDIVFFNSLSTWNIDFNKFNFLFREINHFYDGRKWTCDNIHMFPKRFLNDLKEALLDPDKPTFAGSLHNQVCIPLIKRIGEENIHFIQEEEGYSGYNKFYILDRYTNKPGDVGPTTIEAFNNLTEREIHEIKFGNFTRWS